MRFELEGRVYARRLMPVVEDADGDISCESPVGRALVRARAGERIVVEAPSGDVVVEVLEVGEGVGSKE